VKKEGGEEKEGSHAFSGPWSNDDEDDDEDDDKKERAANETATTTKTYKSAFF
jgi:hypothetical protein